ncbi:acetyl-coenzyme A synthetase, partial [Zavarzinia compransoris]|uniref:acetyl-coenzyme A synthetase N-terminal domain-containing protein n=1 Tax=Zavarzinia marina TaxID=2911065 RepID=UPI002E372A91
MSQDIYPVPSSFASRAKVTASDYASGYRRSIEDPVGFWYEAGRRLDWMTPYTLDGVKDVSFGPGDVHIRWFHDGRLNVAANCL